VNVILAYFREAEAEMNKTFYAAAMGSLLEIYHCYGGTESIVSIEFRKATFVFECCRFCEWCA